MLRNQGRLLQVLALQSYRNIANCTRVNVRSNPMNILSAYSRCFTTSKYCASNSATGESNASTETERTISGRYNSTDSEGSSTSHDKIWTIGAGIAGTAFILYLINKRIRQEVAACKHKIPPLTYEAGSVVKNLPTYTSKDVKEHNTQEKGVWVTYKNGVYDVSKFVRWHPGGEKILLAAGGSLEPYFALYAIHTTHEVMEIMESMRIGNIFDSKPAKVDDAFAKDPERSGVLKVNSDKPFNAEPPPSILVDSYITPNQLFFVRNHLPVPVVDEKTLKNYTLDSDSEITGKKGKSLPFEQIKKLPEVTVTVTMQCAGNRRAEMSKTRAVQGLTWDKGSISTATFKGASLLDVLHAMGYTDEDLKGKHIQFEGLDKDPTGAPYGSSIASEKAYDPNHCVIIAYEMNGEPLPTDHGFPLRAVIPGVVGARNVKWLKRIVISDEESHSHWQRKDYKTFNPSKMQNDVNFDEAYPIQETPVQSAICEPLADAVVNADDEYVTVRGYAFSGGGRGIIRVDLSLDGGKTWMNPTLDTNNQSMYKSWAWTLWEATVPIPKDHKGQLEIVCKAIDSSHNVQPDSVDGIWNVRGLLNNSWHRVKVTVK